MAALIDPDTPDDDFAFLDEASATFLRAIKGRYTRDTAVEVMEALTPILGKDWKGRLIFGIVANKYAEIKNIAVQRDSGKPDKKINAIKAVRSLSGMGLTESKNLIEGCWERPRSVRIREPNVSIGESVESWERNVREYINELRASGYRVEY